MPVIPGSEGILAEVKDAVQMAGEIGYPVIVKASAGGGGRGMRVVYDQEELVNAYQTAQTEAISAFGNPAVYMEKYIEEPKHIEIQLLLDEHGNGVYLGERDCSVQRRHQKVMEESPSPVITPEIRSKIGEAAILGAKSAGYTNAGTVEFLLDKNGKFYFMEMNTRIQVEHPVTEMVTGTDLIKEQIYVAMGERLRLQQKDIIHPGTAPSVPINAKITGRKLYAFSGPDYALSYPGRTGSTSG